ncbi:MAG: LysM peptidoglycan-binding domain-containing protein, partial [Bacteroidia bacterium]|nr:LysM peptidoglycan-binding domain-containing protein [Bacteroidia bacterium]
NCSVGELKKWNHLHSTRLRIGQRLTVYVTAKKKVPLNETTSVSVKATSSDSLKSQKSTKDGSSTAVPVPSGGQDNLKTVYHVVQPGDTLWDIAQQYDGVTVEQIKEINRLHSNNLKVGTKLKVVIEG